MNMNNSGELLLSEIPSYTFVDVITLQNAFPIVARQTNRDELEDQIDNMHAESALKEAQTKGTKSWNSLKRELNL